MLREKEESVEEVPAKDKPAQTETSKKDTDTAQEDKQEERFYFQRNDKVQEVLAIRTYHMSLAEFHKNAAILAIKGLIPILDEKKDGKRVIEETMEIVQMALAPLQEFRITRPVSQEKAFKILKKIKKDIPEYSARNKGLVLDEIINLVTKAENIFTRILIEEENQDYRDVWETVLEAGCKLNIATSNHVLIDVDSMYEEAQGFLDLPDDLLCKLEDRIKRCKDLIDPIMRKDTAINVRQSLKNVLISFRLFNDIDALFKRIRELPDLSDDLLCKLEDRINKGKNLADPIRREETAFKIKEKLLTILKVKVHGHAKTKDR